MYRRSTLPVSPPARDTWQSTIACGKHRSRLGVSSRLMGSIYQSLPLVRPVTPTPCGEEVPSVTLKRVFFSRRRAPPHCPFHKSAAYTRRTVAILFTIRFWRLVSSALPTLCSSTGELSGILKATLLAFWRLRLLIVRRIGQLAIHLFWHFIVRHGGKPNTWHDEFISRLPSRFRFPRRFLLGGLHWPSTGRLTYTVAPSRKQKFGYAAFLSRGAASHGARTDSCLASCYQDDDTLEV